MSAVGNMVPITMISRLIGFQDSPLDELLQAAFDSTSLLGSTLSLDELNALLMRSGDVQTFIAAQLAAAMEQPGPDLLGAVARAVHEGVFDQGGAIITLQTLLGAGGESTTSLLGNSTRMLAEDQELQQRLRENLDLVPTFIEEAMRLESPFRFHMRSAPHDTTLGGLDIPAGSTVLLLWGSANRDDAEFEQPNAIDLDRDFPRHHVGFGRGIHFCVGAPLARIEARSVLTVLLARTSSFELAPGEAPEWVDSLMVRRHERLPVKLVAR
jgi:cytochrome P450